MENGEVNNQEPYIWMPMEQWDMLNALAKVLHEERMKRLMDSIWMDFKEEKINEE